MKHLNGKDSIIVCKLSGRKLIVRKL
jgi:hypothetical protein